VRRAPLVHRVVMSGRVSPPAELEVASLLAGTVAEVAMQEGARVEPGQVLVRLEAAAQEADVARARAAVAQARARLSSLREVGAPRREEAVRQAEVDLAQAEKAAERARTLAEAGVLTRVQRDEALAALEVARSRLASARAEAAGSGQGGSEQRQAEAALAQAEAELRVAEARLAQATVSAPVRAVVLRREVEPGDSVQPGQRLMTLARVGGTQLLTEPDERNLAYLRPGLKAVASADAFPLERFAAEVETVAPSVNPARGTVEVKLAVPEPPPYLRPGMTVSVDVEVGRREDALVLPLEVVRDAASESPWVLVLREGRAERVQVRTGLRGEGKVEVVEGLSGGELVIPASEKVRPGARVRPGEEQGG
jgi:HlyD family secretion protein